jgi:hypothetical protein
MMYDVGPFDGKTVNPVRVGVYHTSPFITGGGGYGYWDGKRWHRWKEWGGWYWEGNRAWWWFGLTEAQSNVAVYKK